MPHIAETELIGKREDISDALLMVNIEELPFVSTVTKGSKPENTLVQVPVDKYDSADASGVRFDQDATDFKNTQQNRKMLYSRVMRQWRNPFVDTAAQLITKQPGDNGDKFAQSRAQTTIELKQDMEKVCLGRQDSVEALGETPPVTRGMGCWTNAALQVDTVTIVPAAYRPASGQIYSGNMSDFYESQLNAVLQSRFETVRQRGELTAYCGTSIKTRVSEMSKFDVVPSGKTSIRKYETDDISTLDTCVELFRGDYGTVKFVTDLEVADSRSAEIVDHNRVQIRSLMAPTFTELENKGGGRRGINETIYALVNTNPQSHCTIAAANA